MATLRFTEKALGLSGNGDETQNVKIKNFRKADLPLVGKLQFKVLKI